MPYGSVPWFDGLIFFPYGAMKKGQRWCQNEWLWVDTLRSLEVFAILLSRHTLPVPGGSATRGNNNSQWLDTLDYTGVITELWFCNIDMQLKAEVSFFLRCFFAECCHFSFPKVVQKRALLFYFIRLYILLFLCWDSTRMKPRECFC